MADSVLSEIKPHEVVRGGWLSTIAEDTRLYDSLLDLIDNAIDSVNDINRDGGSFSNFEINMQIIENNLHVIDNAAGMSYDTLVKAFRGYAEHTEKKLIGRYGIGLQRALYNLGEGFKVTTWQDGKQQGTDEINKEGMIEGKFPIRTIPFDRKGNGTEIIIYNLDKNFKNKLEAKNDCVKDLGLRYGKIINRGLKIIYNDINITAVNLAVENKVRQNKKTNKIENFKIIKKEYNDLYKDWKVGIEVGRLSKTMRERIESDWDQDSTKDGWYIFFNDRCVLLADKTEKTGWGLRLDGKKTSRFHPQYNGFLGILTIMTDSTSTLPFNSAKSGINFEHEGYKRIIQKLVECNKKWTSFTDRTKGKSIITVTTENKPNTSESFEKEINCLFPDGWGKPEGQYAARLASTIEEGQRFENWQELPLASVALIRVTLELSLRHVIRALSKEPNLYLRNGGIGKLLQEYKQIPNVTGNHNKMRNSIIIVIKKFNQELNDYVHDVYNAPSVSDVKDIMRKINPFMQYASHLKHD